jgi:hypothetical protein
MKVLFKAKDFERDLYASVVACNEFMAKKHGEEPFYGFALYVPTYETDCGVCYNTESLCQTTLERYQAGKYGAPYRKEKGKRWHLRWSNGDWPYFSANDQPKGLRRLMKPMDKWQKNAEKQIGNDKLTSEDWTEYGLAVMTSACRVLKKLDGDGAMDVLPRTDDFHSLICDHDEPPIYSYLRYERFLKDGSVIMLWELDDDAEVARVLKKFK